MSEMKNLNNTAFVLISGKRCSGKDTCAMLLNELLENSTISSFADQVKFQFAAKCNLNFERLLNDYDYKCKHRKEMIAYAQAEKEKDINVWVKSLLSRVNGRKNIPKIVIIPDNRFLHETEYFDQLTEVGQIYKIRIDCQRATREKRGWEYNSDIDTHVSECDLDFYGKWNCILPNNSTMDDLRKRVVNFLSTISINKM